MREYRRRIVAVTAALTIGSALVAGPAAADPASDKQQADAAVATARSTMENATARARTAAEDFAAAEQALPGAQDRAAQARGQVAGAAVLARQAAREADTARTAYDTATTAFDTAQRRVTDARAALGTFVAATYRGSGLVAVDGIIDAGSPSEFAARLAILDHLAGGQRRALDEVTRARFGAREKQADAEAKKKAADDARKRADDALAAAQAVQAEAEAAETTIKTLIDKRKQALDVAESERAASLDRYAQAKAESDRIEAELRALAARDVRPAATPVYRADAYFLTPVHGFKTSDFGWRYDPFYHVWQLHAGVDLGAPEGAPIYAAADGRVTRAGWYGGYGNYTCVYHGVYNGQGLATCYGHQSQILVSAGESVRRGEVIGRVGTTGASTGDHLHFEVRLDGTPVQPLNWLAACLC